jgi:hypothetical protein
VVRIEYLSRYFVNSHQAIGDDRINDMITSMEKSFEIRRTRLGTDAPSTFLIPISFVLCSAVNAASPNKPRPVIMIVNVANKLASLLVRLIVVNFF